MYYGLLTSRTSVQQDTRPIAVPARWLVLSDCGAETSADFQIFSRVRMNCSLSFFKTTTTKSVFSITRYVNFPGFFVGTNRSPQANLLPPALGQRRSQSAKAGLQAGGGVFGD